MCRKCQNPNARHFFWCPFVGWSVDWSEAERQEGKQND